MSGKGNNDNTWIPLGRVTSLLSSRAADCIEKLKSKAQDAPSQPPPAPCDSASSAAGLRVAPREQINELSALTAVEQESQPSPADQEDELTQEMDVCGPATGSDELTRGSTVVEVAPTTAQAAGTVSAVSVAFSKNGMTIV